MGLAFKRILGLSLAYLAMFALLHYNEQRYPWPYFVASDYTIYRSMVSSVTSVKPIGDHSTSLIRIRIINHLYHLGRI